MDLNPRPKFTSQKSNFFLLIENIQNDRSQNGASRDQGRCLVGGPT